MTSSFSQELKCMPCSSYKVPGTIYYDVSSPVFLSLESLSSSRGDMMASQQLYVSKNDVH